MHIVFHGEFTRDMHANAININSKMGWIIRWLETNSRLVTLTFKDHGLVSLRLRIRWLNCIELTKIRVSKSCIYLTKRLSLCTQDCFLWVLELSFLLRLLLHGFDLLFALHSFSLHQGFIPSSFFEKSF